MSDTLFRHYERELIFIRQMAQEFARQYPAAAGRLLLEPGKSADPHIERMIEAFALLSGRVQHKIDDEFPELSDALLSSLYPHYLAPIPSCAVVQFVPDPAPRTDEGRLPLAARQQAADPARGGHAVPLPDGLSGDALAGGDHGGAVPAAALSRRLPSACWNGGGFAPHPGMPGRQQVLRPVARLPAPAPHGRSRLRGHPARDALQQRRAREPSAPRTTPPGSRSS